MYSFFTSLKNLNRTNKLFILVVLDIFIAFICWTIFGPPFLISIAYNFEVNLISLIIEHFINYVVPCFISITYFIFTGFYRTSLRFSNSRDLVIRGLSGALIFGYTWGLVYILENDYIRNQHLITIFIKSALLSFVFYAFIQISREIARIFLYKSMPKVKAKPVLIYGAGAAGNEVYRLMENNKEIDIIGFYDNSLSLGGAKINNIKIYGKEKHIKNLLHEYPDLEIYLAIPSLTQAERRKIINSLEKYKVAIRSIPSFHDIVTNQKKMIEMQDLSIDDILPRARINASQSNFFGKNILITGAGGSIGSEIARQVLSGKPKKIILFEISEINLYSIHSEILKIKDSQQIIIEVVAVLGDVKDRERVDEIIRRHDINYIYHAAAYKHVPIVEYHENIIEGIKNNVFGTKVLCDSAVANNVEKVVVISTDKAVRPTNIMGASKRFAEMLVQSLNDEQNKTIFCMVRFGNVINSSGSVIPLFRKQIAEGGPVTITHKNVTRYFMTIAEASGLVIQAGEYAEGGDVFILDMGEQIKILDLAKKLIYLSGRNISTDGVGAGIEIKEIGLRPGEKLYEELLISGKEESTPNDKIFKSKEHFPSIEKLKEAKKLLKEYAQSRDIISIKKVLQENVEGFN